MPSLETLDWVVIALYGVVVIAIGAWANRRQKTTEDYFLGGRRMRWWAVGISLIATSFSSVALIGGTGEGFSSGTRYLRLQLGDLLAIAIAVGLFLPFFARLGLTTAYEYLEVRFGVVARTLASLLFIAQTLMRAAILVLAPALALSTVLSIDLDLAIVLSGLAAILYSAAGGITAVVWTDMIQLAVVIFGVVFSIGLVAGDLPGGLGAIFEAADLSGLLDLDFTDVDLEKPYTPLWTLIAYGTLALSVAGANQQAVQRYLSCEDVGSARKAAFLGWGVGVVAVGLTLVLGVALALWSQQVPAGAVLQDTKDQVLPVFILHRLPAGLGGLLVAAIFAASMSSMDSAIHSMSTATLVDFVKRFRRRPLAEAKALRLARVLTAAFGIAAVAMAWIAAREQTQLLRTLFTWLGYFAGPLLGLFVLGMATKRANQLGAVVGALLAGGGVVTAVLMDLPKTVGFQRLWLAPAALLVTVLMGYGVSLATGTTRRTTPDAGGPRRPSSPPGR